MADNNAALGLAIVALGKKAQGGGGGEPTNYLKSAAVADNTLTLTKKDDTTVVYTPTVPTKTSDLTNDSGFLTEHQSLAAYRTSADQDVIDNALDDRLDAIEAKEDGWDAKSVVSGTNDGTNWSTITINGTTKNIPNGGQGGEPAAYIKNAEVADTVLTLTKKDNTTVIYNPDFATEAYVDQSVTGLAAWSEVEEALEDKQDIISDLSDIRDGATLGTTSIQPNDNISDLTNDIGFITKAVNDLTNYYLKSENYTKTEVNNLLASVKQFSYEIVDVLPTASSSTMYKIYLTPNASGSSQDIKDEYITIDNGVEAATRYTWEKIGNTAVDLSAYRTSAAQDVIDAGKQATLTAGSNISISNNVISATDTTYAAGSGISINSENEIINSGVLSVNGNSGTITGIATSTDLQQGLATKMTSGAVSASASGSSTTEVNYLTIEGTEYKLPSGSGASYTAGNGIDITNNVITNTLPNSLFIATSQTSTYAEVKAAYDAGKTIVGNLDGRYTTNIRFKVSDNEFYFIWLNTSSGASAIQMVKHTLSASGWTTDVTTTIASTTSPTFTGTPTAPTATSGTNTTQLATTAFVQTAITSKIPAAPASDGTYVLQCVVSGGTPTYSWVELQQASGNSF